MLDEKDYLNLFTDVVKTQKELQEFIIKARGEIIMIDFYGIRLTRKAFAILTALSGCSNLEVSFKGEQNQIHLSVFWNGCCFSMVE